MGLIMYDSFFAELIALGFTQEDAHAYTAFDPEFKSFSKIPRLSKETMTITEKIDGSNGLICVWENGNKIKHIRAGSRNQWLDEKNNNFLFYQFVMENAPDLINKLGVGYHYGEWYGKGINRNYGLQERRFALFNTSRWGDPETRPECCQVVPVLGKYELDLHRQPVKTVLELKVLGSKLVPGFMKPEGIIVHLREINKVYKVLIDK